MKHRNNLREIIVEIVSVFIMMFVAFCLLMLVSDLEASVFFRN